MAVAGNNQPLCSAAVSPIFTPALFFGVLLRSFSVSASCEDPGDLDSGELPPAATQDAGSASSSMRRQDSSTSLATVNISVGGSTDGGPSFTGAAGCQHFQAGDEGIEDVSLSGASVTGVVGQAASVADSASSVTSTGLQVRRSVLCSSCGWLSFGILCLRMVV